MPDTPPESGVSRAEQQRRAELREKYLATIQRLWTKKPDNCPICDSNLWNIGDLIQAPIREVGDVREAVISALAGTTTSSATYRIPQVYIYVPITCLVCGYTLFFHAGVLDVRDEEEVKIQGPIRRPRNEGGTS